MYVANGYIYILQYGRLRVFVLINEYVEKAGV